MEYIITEFGLKGYVIFSVATCISYAALVLWRITQ